MNGEPYIHLGGHSHHRSAPDVFALFDHVAAIAPGSYGLLHVRDDEDPGHENEIRVLRLARGTLTEHTEPLLSLCVPTLEDPFTGWAPLTSGTCPSPPPEPPPLRVPLWCDLRRPP
ncbi:Imm7 family immunity protein [Streptomyces cellostaticus]|uniref:Imm7 family immunity protein n=1 Tax=Streptomyces cellostaticus TaxID=67285 RepID=UPI0024465DEE|nr:Imm7 family immunity protein [Streptomyces cellostaticus]GHI03915.1 hypothetical protein Scel_22360 [Streptomyces cellostaticus]